MNDVLDLDALRPAKRIVKLGGKEIDVSWVPVGITFELSDIINRSAKLDQKKLSGNDAEETMIAYDLTLEMCVVFCSWKHPEMDKQWFRENVDNAQLTVLADEIRKALVRSYEGVDLKNAEAAGVENAS